MMCQWVPLARSITRSTQAPSVESARPRQNVTDAWSADSPVDPGPKSSGPSTGSSTAATTSSAGSPGGNGYGANGTHTIVAPHATTDGNGFSDGTRQMGGRR